MSHPIEALRPRRTYEHDPAAVQRQRARFLASVDGAPSRRRPWLLVPALVPIALTIAVALWPARRHADPRQPLAEVGRPIHSTLTPTELSFPDGSKVTLAPETRAHLEAFDQSQAVMVIDSGSLTIHVQKGTPRTWRYRAGPFTVAVVGTVLSVAWRPERSEVEVAVSEGRVSVTGPGLETPLFIGAGESLRRVLTSSGPAPAEARPPAFPAPGRATHATPAPRAPLPSWRTALSQGRWGEALDLAKAAGVLEATDGVHSDELLALADAARLDAREELALRLLADALDRGGALEAQAAFVRGQLHAEHRRQREALDDFERSLRVEPRGPSAQSALGRSIDLLLDLGETSRARDAAKRYLAEYPSGPWSTVANHVVDGEVMK